MLCIEQVARFVRNARATRGGAKGLNSHREPPLIDGDWGAATPQANNHLGGNVRSLVSHLTRLLGRPDVVVPLHLVQDLDLALPVMNAMRRQGLRVQPWVSNVLIKKSPRVSVALREHGWTWQVLTMERAREAKIPWGVRAVVTAVETNLGPHRFSRLISEQAVSQGLFVATMQHGFENVGLTYSDSVHPLDGINFAAQRIYLWGSVATLLPDVSAKVRDICVPVGCPKPAHEQPAHLPKVLADGRAVIGVFENLHWHRYDDAYRAAFIDSVLDLARTRPDVILLVKPHHAGMWLSQQGGNRTFSRPNLIVADPADPEWEPCTAGRLLHRLSAVITTPSTVALDAARAQLPVAVFAGGLALPAYEPLTMIRSSQDSIDFCRQVVGDTTGVVRTQKEREWLQRVLLPGDGAELIASDVRNQIVV